MGAFSRFEQRLEHTISSVFARTFQSAVQPVEIVAALTREADRSAQIMGRDHRMAPNDFVVEVAETDYERLEALGQTLISELVNKLSEHAATQRYVFTGPVGVTLEVADDLSTGRLRVRSRAMAKVTSSAPTPTETAVRRSKATLEINGERLPLTESRITIGRAPDADLRINDPGVSRQHAEIRVVETDLGAEVTIQDLGSTNGIQVNGRKTVQSVLEDGSHVLIGNTTLILHQEPV